MRLRVAVEQQQRRPASAYGTADRDPVDIGIEPAEAGQDFRMSIDQSHCG